MRGDVDPPALLADAQLAQDPEDGRLLRLDGHRDVGRLGPRGRLGHQRRQRLRQRAEDRLHARRRQPVVVVGQERVVGMAAVVEARRVLAREDEVALERRREEGEVRPCARVLPHRLALGGRLARARRRDRPGRGAGDPSRAAPRARRRGRRRPGRRRLRSPPATRRCRRRSRARARGAAARRAAAPATRRRPAASSCADPRPPGGRARRGRPARPAARAGTPARTSATGYAPRPDPRSSGHGRRLPRLRPRGLRVVRRARARQLEGLLHRDPRALRDRGPRRPAGDARGAQPDASAARSRSFASSATCASRPPGRRPTRRGPTVCCTASAGRRPPSTRS